MKVAVGLSGGVDSSVAALKLKQAGYEVVGVYLKTWDEDDPQCPSAVDADDARAVAHTLGIPFYTFDLKSVYKQEVFAYFLNQLRRNRTPNPDILCNKYVKFGAFLDVARELGCEKVATGHYARVGHTSEGKPTLEVPEDERKDQTYFLYTLQETLLEQVLFPLSEMKKEDVRLMAEQHGLVTAKKKDSVGICMVGDRDYRTFVREHLKTESGPLVEKESGMRVGTHEGVILYTVGQRQGLGIGGVKDRPEQPWFVVGKDLKTNMVWVSQNEELLAVKTLQTLEVNWVNEVPSLPIECEAKVRYRGKPVKCTVDAGVDGGLRVELKTPERAVCAGQSLVLYQGGRVLGGAEIESVG